MADYTTVSSNYPRRLFNIATASGLLPPYEDPLILGFQ